MTYEYLVLKLKPPPKKNGMKSNYLIGQISFFLRFYLLLIHEKEREAETQAEGEAGSMLGLDPGTPGSCPGPKADAEPLSHPGIP